MKFLMNAKRETNFSNSHASDLSRVQKGNRTIQEKVNEKNKK